MNLDSKSSASFFESVAREDFEQAIRKGYWRSIMGWFNKSSNKLLPFDEIRKYLPVQGQFDVGMKQIPVEKIVGSVGRYNDFDRAFLPRQRHTRSRWISIDVANLKDVALPPIEAYKVGPVYFVKDGNHRVSVARERGQKFIDAHVIEVVTDVPIDEKTNIDQLICSKEKILCLETTHLRSIRPDANIELTLPGQYEKILEHINVHRWYMGEKQDREVPYLEAVASWYDEVYSPLAKVIKEQEILKEFPGRTVADMYLWIIEHLYYLKEEFHEEISIQDAANRFTTRFSRNPVRRLWHLFRQFGKKLSDGLEDASDLELGIMPEDMMIDTDKQDEDSSS
jgi:hypothetical protein